MLKLDVEQHSKTRGFEPATSEIIYTEEETELLMAIQAYKKNNDRNFPTCREIMHVMKDLGWKRQAEMVPAKLPPPDIMKLPKVLWMDPGSFVQEVA